MKERKKLRNERYKTILARGFLQVPHLFIERFGLGMAVCLANLINWGEEFADENDGWFFQPIHRQMKATGIGDTTLRRYKKTFQNIGIITTKRMRRMEGIRINYDVLCDFIQSDAPIEVYRHKAKVPIYFYIGSAPILLYRHTYYGNNNGVPMKSMVLADSGKKCPYTSMEANNNKVYKKKKDNNSFISAADNFSSNSSLDNSPNRNITTGMFERFWEAYPKKVDKGKVKNIWKKICSKPPKDRPGWKIIRKAIHDQKKTERWQDSKYIPYPTTWLNEERWLDDPAQMIVHRDKKGMTTGTRSTGSGKAFQEHLDNLPPAEKMY